MTDLSESEIQKLAQEYDDSFGEPAKNQYASYGGFRVVGHGEKASEKCGRMIGFKGCMDEAHSINRLDGGSAEGKVFVRLRFHTCNRPDCPVCYLGWAVRQARLASRRLDVLAKRFGLVEHLVISVPVKDYHLSYEQLKAKVVKVMLSRGVVGGAG